jgi:hypothetical protein
MKNTLINLVGGLVGAGVLTLLHETVRRLDAGAPREDLVGEAAVNNVLGAVGSAPLKGKRLHATSLAGDLLANSLYYSSIGGADDEKLLLRGATVGITAGLGALSMAKRMGMDGSAVNRTGKAKLLTVGYYLAGGVAAAVVIKGLRKE